MKFETPAGQNPIDLGRAVGQPLPRVEGPLKVTGLATYAAEWHAGLDEGLERLAHGWIVPAPIAKGTVRLNTRMAHAAPGVLAVVTRANCGELNGLPNSPAPLLAGEDVAHYHQPLALIVAESLEQARAAAALVAIEATPAPGNYDMFAAQAAGEGAVAKTMWGGPTERHVGDFDAAFAASPVTHEADYTTAHASHAMIEPHASIASWEDEQLTLWTSNQVVSWARPALAHALGIEAEQVRVIAPYVGGGFGAKLFIQADAVLAALGAKATGRPVKVVMPRTLVFNLTAHRSATVQRVRLGAGTDGVLNAIAAEGWSANLPGGMVEPLIKPARAIYAAPHRFTRQNLIHLDLPGAHAMRAPGDAPGSTGLEIAIDELAEKLGMDPIALRLANDTALDPEGSGKRFSQRHLAECLTRGAAEFGWERRAAPGSTRDGRWLVGIGVAAAERESPAVTSGARVRLEVDGSVTVETDMTDIGTGSYTIIAQTAAEMMGVPVERVTVKLGDTDFPESAGSGGQFGANSATSGVYAACVALRAKVAEALGIDAAAASFANGQVIADNRAFDLAEAARGGALSAEDAIEFGGARDDLIHTTFGAHFVEVGVDADTGEVRLRRMLAVVSAGRILNPVTARSQVIGGMVMGAGAVLSEELVVDPRHGLFLNHDLAGYEVPVHADIPEQRVIFVGEADPNSSPMKAHGIGELGICGVGGAIANAVYNACGVRVRQMPITLDKLLAGLPEGGS